MYIYYTVEIYSVNVIIISELMDVYKISNHNCHILSFGFCNQQQ